MFQLTQTESSPIAISTTETSGHRFRRGHSFSWSFVPMSPSSEPSESIVINDCQSAALLIWLHSGSTEFDPDAAIAMQMCDGNWLHVQINAEASRSAMKLAAVMDELCDIIGLLCETYSMQADRIYLVATGRGTGSALRMLFKQPETFRGIALFNPEPVLIPELLDVDERLSRGGALLVHTVQRDSPIREMFTFGRLLHAVGLRMTTHFCLPNRQPLGPLLLSWIADELSIEADWRCHW